MERQQQIKSLDHLQQEKERLTNFINKREQLYHAIGDHSIKTGGKVQVQEGVNIVNDIKIGRVKAKVEASRLSAQNHLEQVESTIIKFITEREDELISRAQTYLDDLDTFRGRLEELQGFSPHLREGTLTKHTQEFEELKSQPEKDSELQIALELREQRIEQERQKVQATRIETEEQVLPNITFDEKERTFQVDDSPTIRLSKIDASIVGYLYDHPEEIPTRVLFEAAKEAGSNANSINIIWAILKRLESRVNKNIFRLTGVKGKAAQWSLPRQITEAADKDKKRQEGYQIFNVTLPGDNVIEVKGKVTSDLLNLLVNTSEDNPAQIKELAKSLYGKDDEIALKRIKVWVRSLQVKTLKSHNFQIVQVGKGQEAAYYLEKAEVDEEDQKEKLLQLFPPNGQIPEDFSPNERKILEALLPASDKKPIARKELARSVYGDDLPLESARHRLGSALNTLRVKLRNGFGWTVSNLNPKTSPKGGFYFLEKVTKPEEISQETPTSIETLQNELEALRTRRQNIEGMVNQGVLEPHFLTEVDEGIIQREAQLKTLRGIDRPSD